MKTLFVTIEEFLRNGGVLEIGREIYHKENRHFESSEFEKNHTLQSFLYFGKYVGKNDEHGAFFIKNSRFRSCPVTSTIGYIKINAKPEYK